MAGHLNPVLLSYQYLWEIIDWIFPPFCGGCGQSGYRWCDNCHQSTEHIPDQVCNVCGVPTRFPICDCENITVEDFMIRSWGKYGGALRQAIQRLKYHNDIGLADTFSRLMIARIEKFNWDFDLVIPVPLSRARLKERGYNQSSLLARPIAWKSKKVFSQRALMRVRDTISQTTLDRDSRVSNVQDAFLAEKQSVYNKNVLLVDDLATTGATLNACAVALRDAGAGKIYAFTLARTLLHD